MPPIQLIQRNLAISLIPKDASPETIALSALAVIALAMLVLVTGGIVYLTAIEWRDRRRRDRDRRSS